MRSILLTGAAGFAGSHALRHLLVNTDAEITCPVSLDHKGVLTRIEAAVHGYESGRVRIVPCDLAQPLSTRTRTEFGKPDVIVNYAAQSHVERSITEPVSFAANNVALMLTVLEYARTLPDLKALVQVSTDEVYGPCPMDRHPHKEWSPIVPSNPYAASKAAQEALAISYWRSFDVPLIIVNSMNMFGEHAQNPEKFVPKVMRAVSLGETVSIHCAPDGTSGSRCWIHARNVADGILFLTRTTGYTRYSEVAHRFAPRPQRYNIAGPELSNLAMARKIAAAMGGELKYELVDYHSSRPGHDLRYALDSTRMSTAGWTAPVSLDEGIARMVAHEVPALAPGRS